jgi:pYEATS domain-containing protein involved in immunity
MLLAMLANQGSGDGVLQAVPTSPNLDPGFWSLLELAFWIVLAVIVLSLLRPRLLNLFDELIGRIRRGAALKIFDIELGAIRVSPDIPAFSPLIIEDEDDGTWENSREAIYKQQRLVFIAHRLFPSQIAGQLYDILIYLVPHEDRGGTLKAISEVSYYLGSAWEKVFTSTDSGNRFGIVVSAYGKGFLCCARVKYHDGTSVDSWRYIDFEMGPLGDGGVDLKSHNGPPGDGLRNAEGK